MKYTLSVNQKQAIDLGIENIQQAIIFEVLVESAAWASTEIIDNQVYYWVARQRIADELPLLDMKHDTVYRHLKSLDLLGLINYRKNGKKDCVQITDKGRQYITMSEKNPNKLGKKSENDSEKNPTYPNTNNNPNTNDNGDSKHKHAISHDWFPNETNKEWISCLPLDIQNEVIRDFIDYFVIDGGMRTEKGWQLSFRKNPVVKRRITNYLHGNSKIVDISNHSPKQKYLN